MSLFRNFDLSNIGRRLGQLLYLYHRYLTMSLGIRMLILGSRNTRFHFESRSRRFCLRIGGRDAYMGLAGSLICLVCLINDSLDATKYFIVLR